MPTPLAASREAQSTVCVRPLRHTDRIHREGAKRHDGADRIGPIPCALSHETCVNHAAALKGLRHLQPRSGSLRPDRRPTQHVKPEERCLARAIAIRSWLRLEYGIGLDLVGKAIEEVTGEDLESYFRRYILDPLGMHDTSFLLRNDMARRLVGTHMRDPDGKPIAISIEPLEEAEFHTGGAGLFSPRLTTSLSPVCYWQAARSTASRCSSRKQ